MNLSMLIKNFLHTHDSRVLCQKYNYCRMSSKKILIRHTRTCKIIFYVNVRQNT